MLSADPIGASSGPPEGVTLPGESSPAARRLRAALERISAALVRRAESEAAERDRREHEEAADHAAAEPDGAAAVELRARVDAAIEHLRAILGDL